MRPALSDLPNGRTGHRKKALVVVSSEGFQIRLTGLLEREGWDFSLASTPDETVEKVETGDYSVVLLDTLLPRTNGFDLCRRIKSLPRGGSVPVFLFGGNVVDGREDIITLWGCEDFFPKTIGDDAIIGILRKLAPADSVTPTVIPGMQETQSLEMEETPPSGGRLSDKSILELFYDFHKGKQSGTLTLRNGDVEKAVYFNKGRPTFAITNQMEDKLGEVLKRMGRLSDVELKDALDISERKGKRLGIILVDMEIIKAEELRSLVQRHMEEIIFGIFEWEDGEYLVTPMDISKGEEILIEKSTGNVIMDGVRRRYTLDRIKKILGPSTRVFRLTPSPAISIQDLRLSPSEAKIVDLIDGSRSMEEIMSSSALTPLDVSRVLFCLLSLKIIEETRETLPAARFRPIPRLPLNAVFILDPVALLDLDRDALSPASVDLLKLFDGRRTLQQVIEESSYRKEETYDGIQELFDKKLLKTERVAGKSSLEPIPDELPPVGEPSGEIAESVEEVHQSSEASLFDESHEISETPLMKKGTAEGTALRKALAITLPPLFVILVIFGILFYRSGREQQGVHNIASVAQSPGQSSIPGEPARQADISPKPAEERAVVESIPVPRETVPAAVPPPAEKQNTVPEKPKMTSRESNIARLRRAAKKAPNSVDTLLNLGVALEEKGDNVEGILYIKKALSLDPGSAKAHFAMGKAYRSLGDKDKALTEFKEALRLEPSGPYSDQSTTLIIELMK